MDRQTIDSASLNKFLKSYENSLSPKSKRDFVDYFGIVGGFIGTASGLAFPLFDALKLAPDAKYVTFIISLIAICILILLFALKKYKYSKYHHFANHMEYCTAVTLSAISSRSKSDIDQAVEKVVNDCADVFSIIHNKLYLVTAKKLDATNEGNFRIINMYNSRQPIVGGEVNEIDRNITVDLDDPSHYTSLSHLLNGKLVRYFLSRNIPKDFRLRKYSNPRLSTCTFKSTILGERAQNYTLLYKSTLVVPIRRPHLASNRLFENLGFLCADSPSKYAFRRGPDVEILSSYANLIFMLFNAAIELDKQHQP